MELADKALKTIRFIVPGNPFGKQRHRVAMRGNYSSMYTPKETIYYENLVKISFQEAARGKRFDDEAMLDVRIIAYFGIPKSTSKKKRGMMLNKKIRPTKKPDGDNIAKSICDGLNKVAYHDDSSIVDMQVRKFYSEQPRVEVTINAI